MPTTIPCFIDGVIPQSGLVALVSQSGAGKTFHALGMALSMASRRDWYTRAADAPGVLYVVGEGFLGIPARVLAWCSAHSVDPSSLDGRIGFCRVPFDITDEVMCARIAAEMEAQGLEWGVVFLDTLSANAPTGFDENGTGQMKAMMDAARHLRDLYHCTVVIVHHMGLDATRERGNTDFRGAMDMVLFLKQSGQTRTLSVSKSRDLEPWEPMHFRLTKHEPSAVLELLDSAEDSISPAQRACLLRLAEESLGAPVKAADWQRVSGYARGHFFRIRAELEAAALVVKSAKGYVLTQAGQDHITVMQSVAALSESVSSHIEVSCDDETDAQTGLIVSPSLEGDYETGPDSARRDRKYPRALDDAA